MIEDIYRLVIQRTGSSRRIVTHRQAIISQEHIASGDRAHFDSENRLIDDHPRSLIKLNHPQSQSIECDSSGTFLHPSAEAGVFQKNGSAGGLDR